MTTHYHPYKGALAPSYVCVRKIGPTCQHVHGAVVDEAISSLVLEMVTPLTLELALEVQTEVCRRFGESQRLRMQGVERARYEAEVARDRFLQVDPRHRLVAVTLEADWNEKLRALAEAQAEVERQENEKPQLNEQQRNDVLDLSRNFPRLWKDPCTPAREKKRLLRLLIEDVTLLAGDPIEAHVRFRGGPTRSLSLARPKNAFELRRTPAEVVRAIDALLDQHTEEEVAEILNEQGMTSGGGLPFHTKIVAQIRRENRLATRTTRLRKAGCLHALEAARHLRVGSPKLQQWAAEGKLRTHSVTRGRVMYQIDVPPSNEVDDKEVQYEA
jgi:hypothetical protein